MVIEALKVLRALHILGAVLVAGAVMFNTLVVIPALRRVPPAQAAVVAQRVGNGLIIVGWTGLLVQGVTGFLRLARLRLLDDFVTLSLLHTAYGRWLGLMVLSWLLWIVAAAAQTFWFRPMLLRKLPYGAGLRELERRRALLARISSWQERLSYFTLALAIAALVAGGFIRL
ncbi:MAG: hypothetical protein RQ985_08960 [Dehalococcoidia bacterium]|nr:hypothetical protein [Dehalococcoidia bacterium]